MDSNITDYSSNVTLYQVSDFFNISLSNVTNQSEVEKEHLFDLYEAYRTREKEQLVAYKFVAYIVGSLIVLSNLTVVISSGLILRKGQQPKSTYLLLGNVSLADTIAGFSLIFGAIVDNSISSNPLCIFQIGMIVCSAMVSIFSVGLIAVDRYIYILHGLYYQQWFNTTRVRIGIICIWMTGVTLGFMPATGWINREILTRNRCYYVALFPGALILINSFLSIVPIIVVAILYSIILVRALKNVKNINATTKTIKSESNERPTLRIYRGNTNKTPNTTSSVKNVANTKPFKIKRSASFSLGYINESARKSHPNISIKAKSIDDLCNDTTKVSCIQNKNTLKIDKICESQYESEISIYTIESSCSDRNYSVTDIPGTAKKATSCIIKDNCKRNKQKQKEPNKWRAITVVMLTSGSFIFTWLPFFIAVIFFVLCEEKEINPKCIQTRLLLGGPLATLAFFNSLLNPLIYAWWHKGFKRTVKFYFKKYFCKNKNLKATRFVS